MDLLQLNSMSTSREFSSSSSLTAQKETIILPSSHERGLGHDKVFESGFINSNVWTSNEQLEYVSQFDVLFKLENPN